MSIAAVYDDSFAGHWDNFRKEADFAVISLRELVRAEGNFVIPATQ
jgi:hypothetical protein